MGHKKPISPLPRPLTPDHDSLNWVVLACVVFACCHHIPAGTPPPSLPAQGRVASMAGADWGLMENVGSTELQLSRDQDKIPELQQLAAA